MINKYKNDDKERFYIRVNKVINALSNSSVILNISRLEGGIENDVYLIDFINRYSERVKVVLRICSEYNTKTFPNLYFEQWKILSCLYDSGLPVQKPLWLDERGEIFGTPAIVISYLPGKGDLSPTNIYKWTQQMGEVLAKVHRFNYDVKGMPVMFNRDKDTDIMLAEKPDEKVLGMYRQGRKLWEYLLKNWSNVKKNSKVFLHQDFHPGNIIWDGENLSGIVDWDGASVGHAGYDISHCRVDLVLQFGQDIADLFLASYQDAYGERIDKLPFWDLHRALNAIPNYVYWIPGMHGLGRTDLNPQNMWKRLEKFVDITISEIS
jgi:aminoglycoside phosphotransferase (APT) family kinase protein